MIKARDETSRMARKLAVNSRNAPQAPAKAPMAMHRPQVDRGGTMAVEMATPGSTGLMRSSNTARVPASPANTATSKSSRVG